MSTAAPTPETPAADIGEHRPGAGPPAPPAPGPLARIRSIEIENLRGIRRGRLDDLAPLTVLTGPNGSGKSTVLDALDIGGSPNPAEAVRDCVLRRPPIAGAPEWLVWRAQPRGTEIRCVTADGSFRESSLDVSREGFPATGFRVHVVATQRHEPKTNGRGGNGWNIGFEADFRPDDCHGYHTRLTPPTGRDRRGGDLPGVEEVLVLQGLPRHPRAELSDLLTDAIKGGERDELDRLARSLVPSADHLIILTHAGRPVVHFAGTGRDIPVPVGVAGDGVAAALRLGMELLTVGAGVALIEEPEAHLHPAAMRLVARAIVNAVRDGTQVVLTTHSLEFLDCLLDEAGDDIDDLLALFSVWLDGGELKTAGYRGEQVLFARSQISEDLR